MRRSVRRQGPPRHQDGAAEFLRDYRRPSAEASGGRSACVQMECGSTRRSVGAMDELVTWIPSLIALVAVLALRFVPSGHHAGRRHYSHVDRHRYGS